MTSHQAHRSGWGLVLAAALVLAVVPAIRAQQERLTLKGHQGAVTAVAVSPDGKRLATASADRTVKSWDIMTGELVLTARGHTGSVNAVAFSPDGRRLISAGADGM